MRILIGTHEIAGWVQQYKRGFEALGHSVTTTIFSKSDFFDYDYDHFLDEHFFKNRYKGELKKHQYVQRFVRKVKNSRADAAYRKFVFNLIDDHDLIIIFWAPYISSFAEYEYIRAKNKKLVCLFVGSDVRYFEAFQQQYDVKSWTFPEDWRHTDIDFRLRFIRHAEKYSDQIYSVPDQAGLQLKPYYHLQVPVSMHGIQFRNNKRKVPKVLHAPSIPFKKGTDIIESTLERLKNEGVQFEFISIRNTPHLKVLEILSDVDVVVDEMVFHGPGALSFEAMFSGCAVATRYLTDSPACFRPPVLPIDVTNIYSQLKELLTNETLRSRLIEEGRDYAMQHNLTEKVTQGILDNLQHERGFDYQPQFLRRSYKPVDSMESQRINKWTGFVKDCNWYSKYIEPGSREGLNF